MKNSQLSLDFIDQSENESIDFRYEITSYGTDYPVDALVKRIDNGVIFVPKFQRQYVWNLDEASKFIESLILGLPVPAIFFAKETHTNKMLIVDGQQRLLTLHKFYNNNFKDEEFRLRNVQKDLLGKRYKDLAPADQIRLDDSVIHAIIVRQEEPDDNESSVYQIFERLNSGGRPLSPQEIRACIYYGGYNDLLSQLAQKPDWRSIMGQPHNDRLKEEELILRFFSLYHDLKFYQKPLKDFLNKRMAANRDFELHDKDELESLFDRTVNIILNSIGSRAFRLKSGIHTAIFDSVMVAVGELSKKESVDIHALRTNYNRLMLDRGFLSYIDTGTSDVSSIRNRIGIAMKYLTGNEVED